MIYYEKLRWGQLLYLLATRKRALYGSKSIAVRCVERVLGKLHITANAGKIDFGDIQSAPNVRRRAYQEAESRLDSINLKQWAGEVSSLLSIDFELIVKKFFFDLLYVKYEFIELALRYALEHPSDSHIIYIDEQFSEPCKPKLAKYFTVRSMKSRGSLYCFSILLLPVFLRYFKSKYAVAGSVSFNGRLVCEVDGEKTYEMFSSIFESCPSKAFVVENRNAREFSEERLRELQISILGLTEDGYRYLHDAVYKYVACCFRHFEATSIYGGQLFKLFYVLMLGKAETIQGEGNSFVTYEHLITTKAARNEFLKSGGNASIFVPLNAHATQRYFHSEIFINYDVMCSAGKHIEDLYERKRSLTKVFLPTGSYTNHRGSVQVGDKAERIARLKAFKGDSIALTIVSPGICDPTYSHEVKLIRLACELSRQKGVRVFVRLKPVPPVPKYADFYDVHTGGCDSIMLTSSEYELFDFLEVSDLFITSMSNAACDLALCGGQVVFIDYMKDPDLFLYWSECKEVVLAEDESFDAIMKWVRDGEAGSVRAKHKEDMNKLIGYLGYHFPTFDAYKENLLRQLQPHCGHLLNTSSGIDDSAASDARASAPTVVLSGR